MANPETYAEREKGFAAEIRGFKAEESKKFMSLI